MNRFVLTAREQRIIAFVMLSLLVGAGVKHYRAQRKSARPARSITTPHPLSPSPSPTPAENDAD